MLFSRFLFDRRTYVDEGGHVVVSPSIDAEKAAINHVNRLFSHIFRRFLILNMIAISVAVLTFFGWNFLVETFGP